MMEDFWLCLEVQTPICWYGSNRSKSFQNLKAVPANDTTSYPLDIPLILVEIRG